MSNRIVFLDYMRVIACFMVIMVHSCEFFFIDGSEIGIRCLSDGLWVSIIDSAFRCSVPLFVMISAYLLVPVTNVQSFFKKRLVRVVIPFAIWSVLYAVLPLLWNGVSADDAWSALIHLTYNFNDASGHMWFVYMLIGLYLFMPVISPWLEKSGKKGILFYIILWGVSTFFPYIRSFVGDIYGECYWNEYNLLWYFSGFLGYMVLAAYLRRYHAAPRAWHKWGGALLVVAGYFATAWIFDARLATQRLVADLELSWGFGTINVAAMSVGLFLLLKDVRPGAGRFTGVVTDISRLSYGIYLIHIMLLNFFHGWLDPLVASAGIKIPVLALCTFVSSYAVVKLISLLPGSKYVVG